MGVLYVFIYGNVSKNRDQTIKETQADAHCAAYSIITRVHTHTFMTIHVFGMDVMQIGI